MTTSTLQQTSNPMYNKFIKREYTLSNRTNIKNVPKFLAGFDKFSTITQLSIQDILTYYMTQDNSLLNTLPSPFLEVDISPIELLYSIEAKEDITLQLPSGDGHNQITKNLLELVPRVRQSAPSKGVQHQYWMGALLKLIQPTLPYEVVGQSEISRYFNRPKWKDRVLESPMVFTLYNQRQILIDILDCLHDNLVKLRDTNIPSNWWTKTSKLNPPVASEIHCRLPNNNWWAERPVAYKDDIANQRIIQRLITSTLELIVAERSRVQLLDNSIRLIKIKTLNGGILSTPAELESYLYSSPIRHYLCPEDIISEYSFLLL
jgi:hypothetical protein